MIPAIDILIWGQYNVHKMRIKMKGKSQVVELCEVYEEMDIEGKKQMIEIAGNFAKVQKILDDERSSQVAINDVEGSDEGKSEGMA